MKVLIVSATQLEVDLLYQKLNIIIKQDRTTNCLIDQNNFQVYHLNTGVGMLQTTLHLTKALEKTKFDLVLNAGIAGAVCNASIGHTYIITHEHVYDFGAEDHQTFIPMQSSGLLTDVDRPLQNIFFTLNSEKFKSLIDIPTAKGITVNKIHGNENSIKRMHQFLAKQNIQDSVLESMEGAAFAYVASVYKTSCLQIRAVSNLVEPRNRENWKIKEAIISLNENLHQLLQNLETNLD